MFHLSRQASWQGGLALSVYFSLIAFVFACASAPHAFAGNAIHAAGMAVLMFFAYIAGAACRKGLIEAMLVSFVLGTAIWCGASYRDMVSSIMCLDLSWSFAFVGSALITACIGFNEQSAE